MSVTGKTAGKVQGLSSNPDRDQKGSPEAPNSLGVLPRYPPASNIVLVASLTTPPSPKASELEAVQSTRPELPGRWIRSNITKSLSCPVAERQIRVRYVLHPPGGAPLRRRRRRPLPPRLMGRHLGIPPRRFESSFMVVISGVVPGVIRGLCDDDGMLVYFVIPVESFQVRLRG